MALIHPPNSEQRRAGDKLHPCVGLVAGFGFITVAALIIHVVMNALL